MQMPRIGFISHDAVLNGAPITLAELVLELAGKNGREGLALGFPVAGPLLRRYDFSGVELFIFGRSLAGREIPMGRPGIRRRLSRIFASRKFDLVVANSLESFRAVEAAADLEIPVIWLIHELASSYRERREWSDIRSAAGRADRLIFNSRIGRSQVDLLGPGLLQKSRVIYPGITLKRPETGERFPSRGESPVLGVIGDICPQKGHRDLIDAFSIISGRCPAVRLVIAGRVPRRYRAFQRELEDRIRELGLEARVRFDGEFFDIRRRLEGFALLIQPSRRESFGRVAAEALALQVPVAAVRSGGVEEIITDGETGYLVPPRDPSALAAAVLRILDDPETARQTARRGRRAVETRFSLPRYAGDIGDEIKVLLGRSPVEPGTVRSSG